MNRWLVVFVCYDPNPDYLSYIKKIKAFMRFLIIEDIVIVNTLLGEIVSPSGNKLIVDSNNHLNTEMEFSGYYYGLEWYNDKKSYSEGTGHSFILLNDTVMKHGKLRKIEQVAFSEWKIKSKFWFFSKPAILGFWHVSKFLKATEMEEGYFNSKFLAFKNVSFDNFKALINLNHIKVTLTCDNTYKNNTFISENYSLFLKHWLNQSDGWYKAERINDRNKLFFIAKAKSIIHEHYLSKHSKELYIKHYCMIKSSILARMIMLFTGLKY